jgi:hypothetical protein
MTTPPAGPYGPTGPADGGGDRVRVGDTERGSAMSLLGVHFADGRLTVSEYDERARRAAAATTRGDLDALFTDLPVLPEQQGAAGPYGSDMAVYSAGELAEQHNRGARPRAAVMALTVIGTWVASIVVGNGLPLFIIPAVAVLLYVLKIGPRSWHTPSPAALERARVKRMRQEQRLQLEQRKTERRIKQTELTTDAMDAAQRLLGRTTATGSDAVKKARDRLRDQRRRR